MIGTVVVIAQLSWGAQAIPILTRADPTAGAQAHTELRVMSPLLFGTAHLADGRVMIHAMLNLEGWTMPGGQLATGDWGEGFNDRRHPHTLVHELMASATDLVRLPAGLHWSLAAGKGFAPYGTGDPMNRPALVFPVNHHWSQILERYVVIAGASLGPLTLEYGLFNGDEPERYTQWPKLDRFGDSWSVRGSIHPVMGVELGVSRAQVASPEHRNGAGLDHTMWNASASLTRAVRGGTVYALAEWANADEEGAYQYSSWLAEAQLSRGRGRAYARLERTERPEEQRLFGDDFRSVRPHNENSNLGTTRWTVVTAGIGRGLARIARRADVEGIVELAHLHVTNVTGVVFDPAFHYGRNDMWLFSVALRVTAGSPAHRMGRYGVMTLNASQPMTENHHH